MVHPMLKAKRERCPSCTLYIIPHHVRPYTHLRRRARRPLRPLDPDTYGRVIGSTTLATSAGREGFGAALVGSEEGWKLSCSRSQLTNTFLGVRNGWSKHCIRYRV